MHETPGAGPVLLNALGFDDSDIGYLEWNRTHNADRLTVTNEGLTIEWDAQKRPPREKSRCYQNSPRRRPEHGDESACARCPLESAVS
jgi:hypothetical protein